METFLRFLLKILFMKRYIYIFRHGQTYYNKNKVFTGWKDSKLTPRGKKDANKVSKKLKDKHIDLAFQTRLIRSKATLKEIIKFHPECRRIVTDDRIIERSYGEFQGFKHKTIIDKYGAKKFEKWHRSYEVPVPKGESIKQVEKRVNFFIKDILKLIKREKINIAISAHGNSMRPFRRYFEKLTISEMMKLENPWDDYFMYTIEV